MLQNLGFGRIEMRFVQTVGGIRKRVPQELGFKRVEATMCCGQYHFLTIARAKIEKIGSESIELSTRIDTVVRICTTVAKISRL